MAILLRRTVISSSPRAVRPYLSTVILTRTSNRSNLFQTPSTSKRGQWGSRAVQFRLGIKRSWAKARQEISHP